MSTSRLSHFFLPVNRVLGRYGLPGFFFLATVAAGFGQTAAAPEKKRLCIGPIVVLKGTAQKAVANRVDASLRQVQEALDTALSDQINGSRKFEVVARKSALQPLLDEQDFGVSGNVDPATAAQAMKLAGAQYLMLTTITDFAMGREKVQFEGIGAAADREAVRLDCSVQIFDTTTGKLIESARFRGRESATARSGDVTAEGATLTKIGDRLAADILKRLVDVIYPAKVIAKLGTQVTINRGEGTGIAPGQIWSIYAVGEAMIDPDTGENLGGNEAEVGRLTISRVTARLSYGEAVEDNGIAVGQIARAEMKVEAPTPEAPSPAKRAAERVDKDL